MLVLGCIQNEPVDNKEVKTVEKIENNKTIWKNDTEIKPITKIPEPIAEIKRPGKTNYLDCSSYSAPQGLFENSTYRCFELYEAKPETTINKAKKSNAQRIVFYGSYVLYDCPGPKEAEKIKREDVIRSCYLVARFVDAIEHPYISEYLNVSPEFLYKNKDVQSRLINFIILTSDSELARMCSIENDACTYKNYAFQSIERKKLDKADSIESGFMEEGDRIYVFDRYYPKNCNAGEYHEHTHVFNLYYLKVHPLWFEEMLARALHDSFDQGLCNFEIKKATLRDYKNKLVGEIIISNVSVDRRQIDSDLPLENFGDFYSENKQCRQKIIMQLNRDAYANEKNYIRNLYKKMQITELKDDKEVAKMLIEISNDKQASIFLSECTVTT